MATSNEESFLVKTVKWFERNFLELFKTIETPVFFIASLFLIEPTTELINIFKDSSIPIYNIFSNTSFYIFFFLFLIYIVLQHQSIKKRKKEDIEFERVLAQNSKIQSSLDDKQSEITTVTQYLNEAQEAISELKMQHIDEAQLITSRFLAYLFKKLDFSPKERISLYMLVQVENDTEEQDFLHIIGRFSVNVNFNKVNRKRFPKNEGVIGKAFIDQRNNNEIVHLSEDDNEYLEQTKELGINKTVAKKFAMKSKSFYPYMVSKHLNDRIGVLLCESTVVDKEFDSIAINALLMDYESLIIELLEYNLAILRKTNVNGDKL